MGGSQPPVEVVKGDQLGCSPQTQLRAWPPTAAGQLWIEAGVPAFHPVHKLHLMQHRRGGEQVLDGQQLSPAGMAHHEVHGKASLQQVLQQQAHGLGSQALRLEIGSPAMAGGDTLCRPGVVAVELNARQRSRRGTADRHDPLPPLAQGCCQVEVLARKVLMHEQNHHGSAPDPPAERGRLSG